MTQPKKSSSLKTNSATSSTGNITVSASNIDDIIREIREAMAWKGSNDEVKITPKMWEMCIPLQDEA